MTSSKARSARIVAMTQERSNVVHSVRQMVLPLVGIYLLCSVVALPATHFVSPHGEHMAPFTSWRDAATNIQAAVDVAEPGGYVLVTNGVYQLDEQVVVSNGICMSAFPSVGKTVLDAQHQDRCLYVVGNNTRVIGFTLINGHADLGGGALCADSARLVSCIVSNCAVDGCSALGGGVYCKTEAVVSNCIVVANSASSCAGGIAGGVACYGGLVVDCTIRGNSTTPSGAGGGVLCWRGGVLRDSIVEYNSAELGAGILNWETGKIENCTISMNEALGSAAGSGAGVVCAADSEMSGCVVVSNRAALRGGGVLLFRSQLTDCTFLGNSAQEGAGIYVYGTEDFLPFDFGAYTSAVSCVSNLVIAENMASGNGGGVFCEGETVRNCTITSNSADHGGGAYCNTGALVENCVIEHNKAVSRAGGVFCEGGTVRNCTIAGNSAYQYGGVQVAYNAMVQGCMIRDNAAVVAAGGGVTSTGGIANCTVTANSAKSEVGGLLVLAGGVINSIVYSNNAAAYPNWSNEGEYINCCSIPLMPGIGNITNDPQLTPSYRLKSMSPCIDAGVSYFSPTTDIDGEARWDHPAHSNIVSIVDIGADEFVDTDADDMADHWECETFGSPTNSNGSADSDNDELPDLGEYENSTNPNNPDTDADQMSDGWEVDNDLDPLADDAGQDPDADTMNNGGEYVADTDPHDPESILSVINVATELGGIRLDWKGGRRARQYLECCPDLTSTTDQWTAILAVPPPTPLTNAIIDLGATNRTLFYRIRAER